MPTFKQFAESNQITVSGWIADRNENLMKQGSKMDHWVLTLSLPDVGAITQNSRAARMKLPFSTGLGYRRAGSNRFMPDGSPCPMLNEDGKHHRNPSVLVYGKTIAQQEHDTHCCKPVLPSIEMVLECLQSDARMHEDTASFEEWAKEFGLDPDSRKAHVSWEVELRQSRELKRLLGTNWEEFLELEEE